MKPLKNPQPPIRHKVGATKQMITTTRHIFKRPIKAVIEKIPTRVLKHVPTFTNIALWAVDSKGRVSADGERDFGRKSIFHTNNLTPREKAKTISKLLKP